MRKIPTLFVRDPEDRKHVLPEVSAGCEWVLASEGRPTRKWDGTCVMFDGHDWWARREVKPGKEPPADFDEVERDAVTGKRVGWEPIDQSGFARWHAEAVDDLSPRWAGTYELVGPKINGNPENFTSHMLIPHGIQGVDLDLGSGDVAEAFREAARRLTALYRLEGVVWHHPDGRMAKLKLRDFDLSASLTVTEESEEQ